MIKVIPPGSQEFGERSLEMVKFSSFGLRGNDLNHLIKRAGHQFADSIKNMSFDKHEVPIHLIALGSTEAFGPNRNGDGFSKNASKNYHDTFVKHARWYRNHQNKDPKKSYGIVKYSMFNEEMQRIELLVALNATKTAADRTGGLVADEELGKLSKDDNSFGVSMACKVAYDVCSSCGNKAKNRTEYCLGSNEGGHCKHGGLKNNIGTVCDDGHHIHAENPKPRFFDISKVHKPADRTAYVFGKVASSGNVSGAELAELLKVSAPYDVFDEYDYGSHTLSQLKLARELSDRERGFTSSGYDSALLTYSSIDEIKNINDYQRGTLLKALSEEKIALSLSDWLKLTTNADEDVLSENLDKISQYLPNVFSDLVDDPNLPDLLSNNPSKSASSSNSYTRQIAIKYASDCSLGTDHLTRRLWRGEINQLRVPARTKSASQDSNAARQIAKQYAVYQIGFLSDLERDREIDLTKDLIIRQNRIQ